MSALQLFVDACSVLAGLVLFATALLAAAGILALVLGINVLTGRRSKGQ